MVWLDYPLGIVMWRLFWRTMRRGILRQELWNGNRENIWEHLFTRRSLLLWALSTHGRRRRSFPLAFDQPEHTHLRVVHLRSPKSAREWLRALARDRAAI
jgi:hypothetical protein